MRRRWASVLFLALGLLHFLAQFAAWSLHPGNRPPSSGYGWVPSVWDMLSKPLFLFWSSRFDQVFLDGILDPFVVFLAMNSLIWATVGTLVVVRITGTKKSLAT